MSLNVARGKVDFFEILQFGRLGTALYYDFLNLGFKVIASAGSDVPWGGTVGEVRVYAYTGEGQFSADRWVDAFRRGTFVTDGPIIEFRVEGALPGDEVRIDQPHRRLKVVARTYRDRRLGSPSLLQVISQGEVVQEVRSEDPSNEALDLSFDVEGGDGFWIAARAEGRDETYAHTTPVYVVRHDLRFWQYGRVPELIRQRKESLQEIEDVVSVAGRLHKYLEDEAAILTTEDLKAARAVLPRVLNREGKVSSPYVVAQLASQGSALLKRVRKARKIYDGLMKTWHREATLRQASDPR